MTSIRNLVVVVLFQIAAPVAALKAQVKGLTACTCSCCEASVAPSSFLRSGRATTVCTPLFAIAQASSCPAECNDLRAASATALARAEMDLDKAESDTDYAVFCLQNCVHDAASTQSLCTPASEIPTPAPLPVIASSLLIEGGSPANETGALVAQAEGKKALAMAKEATAASAEASLAAAKARAAASVELAHSRGSLAEEVKSELRNTAARAGAYALRAQEAAKKAEEEVAEIENAPKVAAQEAAQAAIRQFSQQTQLNERISGNLQAHTSPSVPLPPGTAAVAAGPYNAAIREVQGTQSLYEAQAAQFAADADRLRAGAKSAESQVQAYEAAGDAAAARQIKTQAHDLLVKSMEKETEAAEALDHARRVGLMVPKYADAAATAASRASILGSQKWLPPAAAAVAPGPPSPAPAASPA